MIHCHKHKIEYGYEPCPECNRAAISKGQDITQLRLENAELKRQIKQFIDAENWGRDAAGYEGEYK